MNHFQYKNEQLYAEDVAIAHLAKKFGTPFYCYSQATFTRHYQVFRQAFPKSLDVLVAYSVKACSNVAILKLLGGLGAGADVVSGGELRRALAAGIAPQKIVFSGVGKTRAEIALALETGIKQFNVESVEELYVLNDIAQNMNKKAPVSLRINPDIEAGGHEKISTGKKEDKFGIAWERAIEIYKTGHYLQGIEMVGLDAHIGSQITSLSPFEKAFERLLTLVSQIREQGMKVYSLDLGGGLGVPYGDGADIPPLPAEYGQMIARLIEGWDLSLVFEPGRLIAANAGVLVSQVTYVKKGQERDFLILDAGMNDLIRPTLYGAYHAIEPVILHDARPTKAYDIVGPVCETGDIFAKNRAIQEMRPEEYVAICSAGAYGAVQASEYNTRPLVPEILVNGTDYAVIRERPDYDEIIKRDKVPQWL